MNIELKTSEIVPGADGKVNPDIVYYNCNKPGHYAPQCPMASIKSKMTKNIIGMKVSQNEKAYPLKDRNFLLGFNAMNNENNSAIKENSILIDS